jgi:hypothetical protein
MKWLGVATAIFGAGLVAAQGSANQESKDAKAKSAVSINDPRAFQGYTLVSPMNSTKSYLLDMEGKVVRTWEGAGTPAITAYLLPNGNAAPLLRRARELSPQRRHLSQGPHSRVHLEGRTPSSGPAAARHASIAGGTGVTNGPGFGREVSQRWITS